MAHLFCETQTRLEAVGLADRDGFDVPLTQAELADVLDLSSVHVNRTLTSLRSAGLGARRACSHRRLEVGWRDGGAEFNPAYLRLWKEPV